MDWTKGVYERGDSGGLGEILFKFLTLYKDKVSQIIVETDERDSYSQVLLRSVRTALKLQKEDDIKSGDIVGVYSSNHKNSCVPYIATLFLGAVVCNFDFNVSTDVDVYLLKLIKPKLIISTLDKLNQVKKCLELANLEIKVIVFEDTETYPKFSDYLLPQENEQEFVPHPVENNKSTAIIAFSSGTTGLPKGVCLSHYALIRQRGLEKYIFSKGEKAIFVSLINSTLYWISAISSLLFNLIQGNTRVICSKFDAAQTWELIEKYKVNVLFFIPYYAQEFLVHRPHREVDTSSLFCVWISSYACPKHILSELRIVLPHTIVCTAYGMTEATVIAMHDLSTAEGVEVAREKTTSIGKILEGYLWKVVDLETEKCLGPNQLGGLRIKSDFLMSGYYKRDLSTAFDAEGYFMTGDVVYYDNDNYFYITDRGDDTFKKGALRIIPSLLEEILLTHPAVKEAAVIGIEQDIADTFPMAVVVLKDNHSDVTPKDIQLFFDKQVNDPQKLRAGVKIIKQLPKTPTEKIRRKEIKRMVLDGEI